MHPIRLLRAQTGITQQRLATMAGTSQPTIALYESGAKSPTLATLQRLASTLELELIATYVPRMTREDHRSLAYHRAVAQKLRTHPELLTRIRRSLAHLRRKHPHAARLLDRWHCWLQLSPEDLTIVMLDSGVPAREMRHVSPCSGVLSPQERAMIVQRFHKEYRHETQ